MSILVPTLPNRFETLCEAVQAQEDGVRCRCGADVKFHQVAGAWWFRCLKNAAHKGIRVGMRG